MNSLLVKFRNLSKDQQLKLIGLVVAVSILILTLVFSSKPTSRYTSSADTRSAHHVQHELAIPQKVTTGSERVVLAPQAKQMPSEIQELLEKVGRADPFTRPSADSRSFSRKQAQPMYDSLTLGGIVWDAKNPLAVINDVMVTVGTTISGKKVTKIFRNKIVLEDEYQQTIALMIGETWFNDVETNQ